MSDVGSYLLFSLDVVVVLLGQADLEDDSLEHQNSLFAWKVGVWVLDDVQIDVVDNLVHHEAGLIVFKLVTVVHAHLNEAGLAHRKQHCDQEETKHENFYDKPLHGRSRESSKFRP